MIYTIPDSQRSAEAQLSDLAWRGIYWSMPTRRLDTTPAPVDFALCGAAKSQETELQRFFNAKI